MNALQLDGSCSLRLLETDVERACVRLLELDGWIVRKQEQNFSKKKKKSVGEKGMADRLCVRYGGPPHAEVLYIEFKRLVPSKRGKVWPRSTRAAIHQKAWIAVERKRGALVWLAGEDFPASIEGFREFYRNSGLCRNAIAP